MLKKVKNVKLNTFYTTTTGLPILFYVLEKVTLEKAKELMRSDSVMYRGDSLYLEDVEEIVYGFSVNLETTNFEVIPTIREVNHLADISEVKTSFLKKAMPDGLLDMVKGLDKLVNNLPTVESELAELFGIKPDELNAKLEKSPRLRKLLNKVEEDF